MVQEIRKIIFSPDELVAAFEAFARTTPKFMPAGKLRSCAPIHQDDTGDGIKLRIQMDYGDASHEVELVYRGPDVLRPMILFCIENNIMLPRDGHKKFAITAGQANLIVELNLDSDMDLIVAPMTSEHIRLIKPDAPKITGAGRGA